MSVYPSLSVKTVTTAAYITSSNSEQENQTALSVPILFHTV